MPTIQAFRGLRYDLGHVGSLSDVIAPPYDVIDAELQESLYERHPCNVIRLILNRSEPGDPDPDERYRRAARFLREWRSQGVLQTETQPALYVYHQQFEVEGQSLVRRGFMGRLRLERFGEGRVFPHEETHAAAKADRLKLITACRANLSQIFGIYPDEENQTQEILEAATQSVTPLEATDHLGVVHRMWPVTDPRALNQAATTIADKPLYIADGHHRYETACNYRDQLAAAGDFDRENPANYVLTMCVAMSDPGMVVLPTHRLLRGAPPISAEQLAEKIGECFDIQPAGEGPEQARDLWEEIEIEDQQGALALYTGQDRRWTLARINATGRQRLKTQATDRSDQWRGLGVSILHGLLLENLLGLTDLPKPKYVHSVQEVIDGLAQGDDTGRDATGQQGTGGAFNLAALVMPATLEHIRQISGHGERMPAKSTYFYPKLLSGLVINPLE